MGAYWLRDGAGQILDATRFLSRLPLPASRRDPQPLAVTLRFAPLAGLLIALAPSAVLLAALRVGLPALAAATLAAASLALLTGALHEDGLADTADGFGGGSTKPRKLEIMRDSRIGSFGALALIIGLLLRVASLQGIADRSGPLAAALALAAAAVLSRALMLVPLNLLLPARPDGLAKAASSPDQGTIVGALLLALPIAGLLSLRAMPDGLQIATGVLFSAAAALGMTRLARAQLGGVTGDVVGATQQVSEVTFLLVLCAGAGPL